MKKTLYEISYTEIPKDCDDITNIATIIREVEEFSDWSNERKIQFTRAAAKCAFATEELGGSLKIEKDGDKGIITIAVNK